MDNNQLPQLPPLLELTEQQVAILSHLLAQVTYTLSEIRFNEPKDDGLRIRQHAAISGERDAIRNILSYDDRLRAQASALATPPTDDNQPDEE